MIRTVIIAVCLALLVWGCGGSPAETVLFDFESDAELDRLYWKCHSLYSLTDKHVTHGKSALQLELFPSDYPGFTPKLDVNDWRGFKAICFDIYNPGEKESLITVRVDDKKDALDYADRYNHRFTIKPGANRVSIPLNSLITTGTQRILNLSRIQKILIFMNHPKEKCMFYIDYIRLIG